MPKPRCCALLIANATHAQNLRQHFRLARHTDPRHISRETETFPIEKVDVFLKTLV